LPWKENVPAFSLLWLSEPDYSQHHTGPGSPTSLGALKSSDQILKSVLAVLEKKGVRQKTDIFVVSDHGFSTISRRIDLVELLRQAGFKAVREKPVAGDIMVVGNGGSALLYVIGHGKQTVRKLVEFLQNSDFAGAIFTTEEQPGCIKSDLVHTDSAHAPDVLVSMRWSDQSNEYGVGGEIVSYDPNKGMDDAYRVEGNGHHASMSSFDMHNTLIAAGPQFRTGLRSDLASGNIDLAPTIFRLLNVAAGDARDGRVLVEALKDSSGTIPTAVSKTFEATAARSGFTWHEYVRITRVGDVTYFDEGNGGPQR
jgi:predicted AlkP superfamily pyrophosphatase or phosphodiesterase